MHELYDIRTKDGSKFCERYKDEYGEIQLKTKKSSICQDTGFDVISEKTLIT